jgi:hypothetical protein
MSPVCYAVLEPVNNKEIAKKYFPDLEIRHNPELVDLFPVELF